MIRGVLLVLGVLAIMSSTTLVLVKQQRSAEKKFQFVKIGGETNACECTHRIERSRRPWWSSWWSADTAPGG